MPGCDVNSKAARGFQNIRSQDMSVIGKEQMERIKGLQCQEAVEDEGRGRPGLILFGAEYKV